MVAAIVPIMPTTVFAEEKSDADLLANLLNTNDTAKLDRDYTITNIVAVDHKSPTLDLNGHVLKGDLFKGVNIILSSTTSYPYTAMLDLIDSNPTATHTDSSLPSGGVFDCPIGLNSENGVA